MMMCINELHSIALNKSVFNSVEEHINELIIVEKCEHKEGWQHRIECLEILKKQKQDYRKFCEDKNDDLKRIQEFIKESYEDDKKLEKFLSNENGTSNEKNCIIF